MRIVLITRCAGSAVDNAAEDAFRAVGFIQHPGICAVYLEFVFCARAAVDDGQVAGAYNSKHTAIGSRVRIPQHIAIEIKSNLAEDGQGTADVDILHQPDDIHRTVRQSGGQLRLTRHGDVQAAREGDILRHSRIVVPLRAVGGVPAVKAMTHFGGGVGLGGRAAGTQNLNGVVHTVELVGHSRPVDRDVTTADLAVDDRAAGHTFVHTDCRF